MTRDELFKLIAENTNSFMREQVLRDAVDAYSSALIAANTHVSGSLGFDEGYSKGYSDATKEACHEIREHYHPNER